MAKFSIILPVRNGGYYVKDCVYSILAQTYRNFNLIVLDNASTDGTLEWISSLRDDRIVIYPSTESLSIEKNWARIIIVPKNEFITCIGHDDLLGPDYLDEMNSLISQFPDASLYQTHFNYINQQSELIRPCVVMDKIQTFKDFLDSILRMAIDVNGTGFMVRASDFDRVGGIPAYPNLLFADFTLWLEVTGNSYKVTSTKNCFSYRLHQSMTTTSPDEKFHSAFELFINYVASLKKEPEFNQIINKEVKTILSFYCKSFAHRLLRTEIEKRNGLSVKEWVVKCDELANLLIDNNSFRPSEALSVRLAFFIDGNILTRKLFLLFKKIYPKPIF